MQLSYDLTILQPKKNESIYPYGDYVQVFIAASFVISITWKHPNIHQQINGEMNCDASM